MKEYTMDDENNGAQAKASVKPCSPFPEFGGDEAGRERDNGATEGCAGSLKPVSCWITGGKQELYTIVQYSSLRL